MFSKKENAGERERPEEELKDSEERLRILFDNAPDAIYLNDTKGNFIDGNKAAEIITGYKRKELIGKSFLKLKLLSRDQIPKAAALLIKNKLGKPTGPDKIALNRKDGSQVTVEIRTFPVNVGGKKIVMGIARDITEREKTEEELRIKESAIASSISAIVITDLKGNLTYANPFFVKLWGYMNEKEVLGKSCLSFWKTGGRFCIATVKRKCPPQTWTNWRRPAGVTITASPAHRGARPVVPP